CGITPGFGGGTSGIPASNCSQNLLAGSNFRPASATYRNGTSVRSNFASQARRRGSLPFAPTIAAPQRIVWGSYGWQIDSSAIASSSLENSSSVATGSFGSLPSE